MKRKAEKVGHLPVLVKQVTDFYPPSRKTLGVNPRMNAKHFPLRRDFAPDEARGEETPSVSSRELHKALLEKRGSIRVIDATLGGGGHTIRLLNLGINVLAIETDKRMIEKAKRNIQKACPSLDENQVTIVSGNFNQIKKIAEENHFVPADGVLFDLGISQFHYHQSRGFSHKEKLAPLDMRLTDQGKVTAAILLNVLRPDQIESLFGVVFDRFLAKKITKVIVIARKNQPFSLVGDLTKVLESSRLPRKNLLIKTFLALRIAVNSELENLNQSLPQAWSIIDRGGLLSVISFHSGEDRLVKSFMKSVRDKGEGKDLTKNPVTPQVEEVNKNPSSRSAKLRVVEKI